MTEKIITKDTIDNRPKKKYYKPKNKREIIEFNINDVKDMDKVYSKIEGIKLPKKVGKYCIGGGDGFCIHFYKKPSWIHRTNMRLLLGWKWQDQK